MRFLQIVSPSNMTPKYSFRPTTCKKRAHYPSKREYNAAVQSMLKQWLLLHAAHPFPDGETLWEHAERTGMSVKKTKALFGKGILGLMKLGCGT